MGRCGRRSEDRGGRGDVNRSKGSGVKGWELKEMDLRKKKDTRKRRKEKNGESKKQDERVD